MAVKVQRDSGSCEGAAADPGLHLQHGDAGARVLDRAAPRDRMRRQVRWREYR